jgi:hypothetical protein
VRLYHVSAGIALITRPSARAEKEKNKSVKEVRHQALSTPLPRGGLPLAGTGCRDRHT